MQAVKEFAKTLGLHVYQRLDETKPHRYAVYTPQLREIFTSDSLHAIDEYLQWYSQSVINRGYPDYQAITEWNLPSEPGAPVAPQVRKNNTYIKRLAGKCGFSFTPTPSATNVRYGPMAYNLHSEADLYPFLAGYLMGRESMRIETPSITYYEDENE